MEERTPQTVLCQHAADTAHDDGSTVAATAGVVAEAAAADGGVGFVAEGKGHHSCVDGNMVLVMGPVV